MKVVYYDSVNLCSFATKIGEESQWTHARRTQAEAEPVRSGWRNEETAR